SVSSSTSTWPSWPSRPRTRWVATARPSTGVSRGCTARATSSRAVSVTAYTARRARQHQVPQAPRRAAARSRLHREPRPWSSVRACVVREKTTAIASLSVALPLLGGYNVCLCREERGQTRRAVRPHPTQRAAILAARRVVHLPAAGTDPCLTGLARRLHTPARTACGCVHLYAAPGPTGLTSAWPGTHQCLVMVCCKGARLHVGLHLQGLAWRLLAHQCLVVV